MSAAISRLIVYKMGTSGFRVGNWANAIPVRGEEGLGVCTAEAPRAQSKEFLIKKYSDLCELCTTMVESLRSLRKFCGDSKLLINK